MKGTWQTTSGGSGGTGLFILAIAALCVAGGWLAKNSGPFLNGTAHLLQALAELVLAVVVLAAAAAITWWQYRRRHPRQPPQFTRYRATTMQPTQPRATLHPPTHQAIAPPSQRPEIHLHIHGNADPERIAAALQQHLE